GTSRLSDGTTLAKVMAAASDNTASALVRGTAHRAVTEIARTMIADMPLAEVYGAPAHGTPGKPLRAPENLPATARRILDGGVGLGKEALTFNVKVVAGSQGEMKVEFVELTDGNHRGAAALLAEAWRTVGAIPRPFVRVVVNGVNENGWFDDTRWIPI